MDRSVADPGDHHSCENGGGRGADELIGLRTSAPY
jgi:hypothetical protein